MSNIVLKGIVRVHVRPPMGMFGSHGETGHTRTKATADWWSAVTLAVCTSSVADLISRMEFGWNDNHGGSAEIDIWIPQDWNAVRIRAMANEIADAAYKGVGTSCAEERARMEPLPKRDQIAIVWMKWVSLAVQDETSVESVEP